ncbi:DUF6777 domain-containing protein [Streptomyces lavendulae]|uniref:DUF6777 domain-containing protein n=1 Tax=Streptomyces lavendulae TaxID=1914 RepID=UPI0024A3FA35|nr:hypothetical protein Slala01_04030 [Streptomyces lavendulae subsp. lavendulae]GLX25382.1 hypothetical protein Slala02_12020 [Streptomyces lavendulae subsp. lavendulae]
MTTQPSGERPPQPPRPSQPPQPSQPSSGRPTGPPSGPLSGGGGAPPPPPPPGGPGVGEPPRGPWWRSVPGVATAAVALVAVVTLVVVLTRPGGGGGTPQRAAAEVFLQPAAEPGRDPFTESSAAKQATPPPETPPQGTAAPTAPAGTRSVSGSSPGLYGGTKDVASCDVEQQITALTSQPAKNAAFASVLGLRPAAVAGYLRALTPVQLRIDTRVTNHGYRDGRATPYQAVLQAGTAVLVDDRGVPRVRCACGNPLGPPVALRADPKRFGRPWSSYRPAGVVVVAPSVTVVNKFVIYDHHDHRWLERDRGTANRPDKPVEPPVGPPVVSPPVVSPPVVSPSGVATPTVSPPEVLPPPLVVTPSEPSPPPTRTTPAPTATPPPPSGTPTPTPAGTPTGAGTPTDTGPPADRGTPTATATRTAHPPALTGDRPTGPPSTSAPPPT